MVLLHELPPGVVLAAGVDEAVVGGSLSFYHRLPEAVGNRLPSDGPGRQLDGGALVAIGEVIGIQEYNLPAPPSCLLYISSICLPSYVNNAYIKEDRISQRCHQTDTGKSMRFV